MNSVHIQVSKLTANTVTFTYDIVEDLLIDSGQSSGPGSHLSGVTFGTRADDSPVGNDDARNLEVGLESFLHNDTGLFESTERSVRDSDQKVLLSGAISLVVVNHLG